MKMDNPAFDYDRSGADYSGYRRTDPSIAAHIHAALEPSQTVLNVGAGGGSYEPEDRYVVAVEPSGAMRAQRRTNRKVPAIIGLADALPFDDDAFDASMAILTVHHWPHIEKGLRELRRVTKNQVLVMTYDPEQLDVFWNAHYFPELIEVEKARYPKIGFITNTLGGQSQVKSIPIPFDCVDGFQEAFYGRPEAFLAKEVRLAQSAWGFLPDGVEERLVKALADDLQTGEWDRKFGAHRSMPSFSGALKLIVAN